MSMRWFLFLIVASVSACSMQNGVAPETSFQNELVFAAAREGDLSELEIQVLVAGDADGETVFRFPQAWGPEEDLGALRGALTVVDAESGDPLVSDESNGSVTVVQASGQPIRLSWTVKQDYDGLPEWGVQRVPGMRPVLRAGYASIIGHTVLPVIEGRDPAFVIRFDGFSSGAAFSQPSTDGRSRPVTLSTATDSIYAFGDYAFSEPADSIVRAAVLGEWALSNDDIVAATSAVLATASSAFDDRLPSRYFVAFTPLPDAPNGSSVIGTSFTESFFILATRNAATENLEHTLIHEILHEWIPGRMGTTDEATDPARMWFKEGFTEYYTQLVLLYSGRVSLEGFLALPGCLTVNMTGEGPARLALAEGAAPAACRAALVSSLHRGG